MFKVPAKNCLITIHSFHVMKIVLNILFPLLGHLFRLLSLWHKIKMLWGANALPNIYYHWNPALFFWRARKMLGIRTYLKTWTLSVHPHPLSSTFIHFHQLSSTSIYLAVPGIAWLYLAVPSCTLLYLAVPPGCTSWLYLLNAQLYNINGNAGLQRAPQQ